MRSARCCASPGSSRATPTWRWFRGQGTLKAGDAARRFAGLPATFWDYTGEGEGVFAELQGALPHLDWQGYAAAQAQRPEPPRPVAGMAPGLVFVLNAQGLGVKDQAFAPLRFYRPELAARRRRPGGGHRGGAGAALPRRCRRPRGSSAGRPRGRLPAAPRRAWLAELPRRRQQFAAGPGRRAGRQRPEHPRRPDRQPDGQQGRGLVRAAHGRAAGRARRRRLSTATASWRWPSASRTGWWWHGSRPASSSPWPITHSARAATALSLDAADLDGDGRAELYLSVAQLQSIRSQVLELRNGKLEVVVKNAPFFLRKVKLAEGPVLLGQELNPDLKNYSQDLAGPIFRVTRSGDTLQRGAPIDLPGSVTLFGFQPYDYAGRPLLARININDKLQLLEPSGATVWESTEYFGGSMTSFERPEGQSGGETRYAFLHPRIEPGPEGTVLVPVNEGNRTFSAFRSFNSSHLKAVAFDGYSVVERWRTKPQGGYLGDFRMADADNDGAPEIVMLVMFSRGGLIKSELGNTALLIYEMQ